MTRTVKPRRRALRTLVFGCFLVGVLASSSGCTVIGAVAGAALDSAVLTTPLWGPAVANRETLKDVQHDVSLLSEPANVVAFYRSNLVGPAPAVLIRPLEGPSGPETEPHYYSWLAMFPLVPYANATVDVRSARRETAPNFFVGPAGGEAKKLRFPLSRFPKGIRPRGSSDKIAGETLRAAQSLLEGELASQTPSAQDCAVAYLTSNLGNYSFDMALFLRERIQKDLPSQRVAFQIPDCIGRYDLKREVRRGRCFVSPGIGFGISGDECVANVPPTAFNVVGRTRGFPTPDSSQIVVTGRIRSLRLEISHISYGLTTVGADLLSFLALPLSTNRLALDLDLQAHRGDDLAPILERSYTIVTDRRTVGLYYGGKFAQKLNDELLRRTEDEISRFADDLQPLIKAPGPVAGAVSSNN